MIIEKNVCLALLTIKESTGRRTYPALRINLERQSEVYIFSIVMLTQVEKSLTQLPKKYELADRKTSYRSLGFGSGFDFCMVNIFTESTKYCLLAILPYIFEKSYQHTLPDEALH